MDDKLLQLEAKKKQLDSYKPQLYDYIQKGISASESTPEQRFYTTEEVAKLLQIDPETVRRYVRQGILRAVKLGGKFIRIEKADLDTFIENLKK